MSRGQQMPESSRAQEAVFFLPQSRPLISDMVGHSSQSRLNV